MGPSEAGKSTLLNLLSGIDRADEVEVAGQRLSGFSEDELAAWRARHVGFVLQFYNLMPVMTLRRVRSASARALSSWRRAKRSAAAAWYSIAFPTPTSL
jgi:ABC-type lipoprotein export system ATPase subunit